MPLNTEQIQYEGTHVSDRRSAHPVGERGSSEKCTLYNKNSCVNFTRDFRYNLKGVGSLQV